MFVSKELALVLLAVYLIMLILSYIDCTKVYDFKLKYGQKIEFANFKNLLKMVESNLISVEGNLE